MKSLDELFKTIMSIPFIDTNTKVRAGFLRTKLCGQGCGYDIFNLFGF
jgi:hypothetical protein